MTCTHCHGKRTCPYLACSLCREPGECRACKHAAKAPAVVARVRALSDTDQWVLLHTLCGIAPGAVAVALDWMLAANAAKAMAGVTS